MSIRSVSVLSVNRLPSSHAQFAPVHTTASDKTAARLPGSPRQMCSSFERSCARRRAPSASAAMKHVCSRCDRTLRVLPSTESLLLRVGPEEACATAATTAECINLMYGAAAFPPTCTPLLAVLHCWNINARGKALLSPVLRVG
eukprot:6189955-Pleurochrysis_carterae.AAC.10